MKTSEMVSDIEKDNLKNYIRILLKDRVFLVGIILIAIAAFGFEITHFSLGIDDFGVKHYMNLSPESVGNMLQQGRLVHLLYYYLLGGLADVIPFLNNFLGTILFIVSSVIFAGEIQKITNQKFNNIQLLLFSGIYISYSILSFKFIYDIDVIATMQSYLCSLLAIEWGGQCFRKANSRADNFKNVLISIFFLTMSIGSYEVFIAVYICEVISLLILKYLFADMTVKDVIQSGIIFAWNLIMSMIFYYSVIKIAQFVTGNIPYERANILNGYTIGESINSIYWRIVTSDLFFAKEFVGMVVCFVLIMIWFTVKKKYFVLFLFPMLVFFTLFIQFFQGYVFYRTCLTFNVFVAFVSLLIMGILKGKAYKISSLMFVLLILFQLKDINLWFYKDWCSYQKNVYAIHVIATDLQKDYDVENKPVCFVNRDYSSFLMTIDEAQQEIGESPLIASVGFLGESRSESVIELFKYQGYNFLIEPSEEQMYEARNVATEMASYPKTGYIQELSDCIVVNIGKTPSGW